MSTNEEWFGVESDGSDATGPALAALLVSFAEVLEQAPENRRYDFEVTIHERTVAEVTEQ